MKAWGQANRGRLFEELITMANIQYRNKKIAVIHKVPTAWLPLRNAQGKIVSAKVEEKAAVDFVGIYSGRGIAFDAKHSSQERIRWDRIEDHQAQFLEEWERNGGISFVLVGFKMDRYFVIPWAAWRERLINWKYKKGSASITSKQMQPQWEVQSNSRAVVDYLGTVDRLIKEGEMCLEKRGKEKNPAKRRALREPI